MTMTSAQTTAIWWLYSDGTWRTNAGREFSAAVENLCLYHHNLVDREEGRFDKQAMPDDRAARRVRYRLTDAGRAIRQKLAHEGKL